jgi:signal transduction histidine kinase
MLAHHLMTLDIGTNVLDSGAHLLNLVNDLLSLARVETHRLALQWEPVDVHALCISVVHIVRPLIEAKKLRLTTEITDDIGVLEGDAQRLRQILVNLLGNASKFTPEDGRLHFIVRGRKTEVEFIVRDSGIGIRAERLQRVFEPFVQADDDFDRRYAGAGLGLALVKRLTELHGGSVAVTSKIGQGSEFRVVIPRWRDESERWGPDSGGVTPEPQVVTIREN